LRLRQQQDTRTHTHTAFPLLRRSLFFLRLTYYQIKLLKSIMAAITQYELV
jgi:hypothetical protein